jgi:hypothetical protein
MDVQILVPPSNGELHDAFCAVAQDALPEGTVVEICGNFADLCFWTGDAYETPEEAIAEWQGDPHFTVTRYPRWLAFGRVRGDLRYCAGPIPPFSQVWYAAGGSHDAGAVSAEPDVSELGRLVRSSVEDAVLLARLYLEGTDFGDIEIERQLYGDIVQT